MVPDVGNGWRLRWAGEGEGTWRSSQVALLVVYSIVHVSALELVEKLPSAVFAGANWAHAYNQHRLLSR